MPSIKNPSDRIRIAQLEGRAIRLARDKGSIADAIADLREMADGRTDLLAQAAGVMGGAWSVCSATETGDYAVAFGLLIMAGADHHLLPKFVELGRQRAMTPQHGV